MNGVLKQRQRELADIKSSLGDHGGQLIRIQEDITDLRSGYLRRESLQAQMDVRLQPIESRLNLSDA